MAEVKLIGSWYSSYTWRVELALKMKGVKYEYIDEDLTNKSPLLLKYNPVHKKVPVLLHNGKAIAESLIILEYIDETWDGPALFPTDPYERAQARFWSRFLDDKCHMAMIKVCLGSGEEQEKAKEELPELLKILEDELKDKKFFGGDNIGLVDIAAIFLGYLFRIITKDVLGLEILTEAKFPNLCKWIDDYNNCSLVKDNVPPKDKLIEKIKARIQAVTSSAK